MYTLLLMLLVGLCQTVVEATTNGAKRKFAELDRKVKSFAAYYNRYVRQRT